MSEVPVDDDIMDFTPTTPAPRFKLNNDVFTAVAELPAGKALRFSALSSRFGDESKTADDRLDLLRELLRMVLTPASAARFIERLDSEDEPIGISAMNQVLPWLFKKYSGTPTVPDSVSSSGPGNQESGKNSTENT